MFIPLFVLRRDRFAVRNIGGVWYNLDSKLEAPEKIKDNDVRSFLGSVVDTDTRAQVMVITTGDTEASSVYMKEEKEGKKEGREENVNERANEKEKERSGKDEEVEANVTTREQKGQDEQPKENGNNAGTTSEKKNETNENTATTEIDENENDGDGDTGEALSTKMQALTV